MPAFRFLIHLTTALAATLPEGLLDPQFWSLSGRGQTLQGDARFPLVCNRMGPQTFAYMRANGTTGRLSPTMNPTPATIAGVQAWLPFAAPRRADLPQS